MKTSASIFKFILVIFFSATTIVSNASVSPIETAPAKANAFTAVVNNSKVELKWSTDAEINLSHFIVERSTDGINFSDAALVFAYGNTSAKSDYAFADNIAKMKTTTIYYRVTSIGADGKTQASDIRVIRTNK